MSQILLPILFALTPWPELARYAQAETLFWNGHYHQAAAALQKFIDDFPKGVFRERVNFRLFDVANTWLNDTREEMTAASRPNVSKCRNEAKALRTLGKVYTNDPDGPFAAKARFLMGSVRYYRKDYAGAIREFREVARRHPKDPLAPSAFESMLVALGRSLSTESDNTKSYRRLNPKLTSEAVEPICRGVPLPETPPGVTLQNFTRIRPGMTLEEVEAVLGEFTGELNFACRRVDRQRLKNMLQDPDFPETAKMGPAVTRHGRYGMVTVCFRGDGRVLRATWIYNLPFEAAPDCSASN